MNWFGKQKKKEKTGEIATMQQPYDPIACDQRNEVAFSMIKRTWDNKQIRG